MRGGASIPISPGVGQIPDHQSPRDHRDSRGHHISPDRGNSSSSSLSTSPCRGMLLHHSRDLSSSQVQPLPPQCRMIRWLNCGNWWVLSPVLVLPPWPSEYSLACILPDGQVELANDGGHIRRVHGHHLKL
ncbi:unnamed protein product [Linum trigynum]|uniref:Uncharacterized protein n=1 Tax=Linum trigynum TaxID=586398 RepID=A0AAV2DF86_9ROSI